MLNSSRRIRTLPTTLRKHLSPSTPNTPNATTTITALCTPYRYQSSSLSSVSPITTVQNRLHPRPIKTVARLDQHPRYYRLHTTRYSDGAATGGERADIPRRRRWHDTGRDGGGGRFPGMNHPLPLRHGLGVNGGQRLISSMSGKTVCLPSVPFDVARGEDAYRGVIPFTLRPFGVVSSPDDDHKNNDHGRTAQSSSLRIQSSNVVPSDTRLSPASHRYIASLAATPTYRTSATGRRYVSSTAVRSDANAARRRKRRIPHRTFSSSSSNRGDTAPSSKTTSSYPSPSPSPSETKPTPSPSATIPTEKSLTTRSYNYTLCVLRKFTSLLLRSPGVLFFYLTHPKELREKMVYWKDVAKKEAKHYYMGSKLLLADIRTARQMLSTTLSGTPLTRRERKQLLRTVSDVFRIIPMSVFVLIPFMEFALPFALKIFPNMLPSTFQDSLKHEENMKRELKSRIAMAEFFQEALQDMAKEQKKTAARRKKALIESSPSPSSSLSEPTPTTPSPNPTIPTKTLETTTSKIETATSFLKFIERARRGEMFPPEVIIKFATYFQDDLTLDNTPRMQLINMCKYMSIPPYGNDALLRLQLRHRIRVLQEDDQRILWEGMKSLSKMELREACRERGMRSTGLSREGYERSLQQWIDLSVNRNVPVTLLIMSRIFFLQEEMTPIPPTSSPTIPTTTPTEQTDGGGDGGSAAVAGIADAISGLDREVVNEAILESATPKEKRTDPELLKLQLEVLERENELIEEEKVQREAAKKEKEEREKEFKELMEKEEREKEGVVEDGKEMEVGDGVVEKTEVEDGISSTPYQADLSDLSSPPTPSSETKEGETLKEPTDTITTTPSPEEEPTTTTTTTEDEASNLSSEEIDAISQLVSPDPVSAERESLERLKAAMVDDDDDESKEDQDVSETNELDDKLSAMVGDSDEKEGHILTDPSSDTDTKATSSKVKTEGEEMEMETKVEDIILPDVTPSEATTLSFDQKEDRAAQTSIEVEDRRVAAEADASTQISMDGGVPSPPSPSLEKAVVMHKTPVYSTEDGLPTDEEDTTKDATTTTESESSPPPEEDDEEDEEDLHQDVKLDKAIARLKTKVESMVDNIEVRLEDIEAKIGDKMHFLDLDGDGILSREEMVVVLQKVLKRDLTLEEAMAIAEDMDENKDGLLSIEELSKWVETNKLVKLVEEGEYAEVDKMIAAKATKNASVVDEDDYDIDNHEEEEEVKEKDEEKKKKTTKKKEQDTML